MAARASSGRLLRTDTTAKDTRLPSSSSATSRPSCRIPSLNFPFLRDTQQGARQGIGRAAEQRAALITLGAATAAEEKRLPGEASSVELLLPLAYEVARRLVLRQLGGLTRRRRWAEVVEAVIHQGIVRCQSFTLLGVAGSLLGSLPCFLEGCGIVLESFSLQFRAMSHAIDPAEIVKLLIEALDMFLIGTALLTFAMGMYGMFYDGSQTQRMQTQTQEEPVYQRLKEGARIRSVVQAKSRFGHAIILLLQAGVLDKFKSVPLVTGLDMACFAGAVLASSAGVFLLSKLSAHPRPPSPCKQQQTSFA